MKIKRILIFSTAYLPMIGGAELAVQEITNRMGGYEFDLICARLDCRLKKYEKIGRVNVYRIGIGRKIDKLFLILGGFFRARKIYKKKDLRLAWGIMASWGSLAALLFKIFHPRVPFLLTLQEGDPERYIKYGRFGLISLSWRLILPRADQVQVISNYLARLVRQFGYQKKIEIIPNGVGIEKFKITIKNLKLSLGIQDGEKIIITVSRLVEKNGIDDLIEAIHKFSIFNFQFSIKLLIIGGGPLKKRLEDSVNRLEIQDKVLFLGEIPNDEVPRYLAMADIFVRPSLSEGLGTAFLEAMAAGVPVIATPVGGIPDFLQDPSTSSGQATGLFCEVRNPKSIAEKINLLLTDDRLRNRIIANGRKLIEKKYNWDLVAKKMGAMIKKIST